MIHFIVFSYNRPLQLHGYLTSFCAQVAGTAEVDVLVRADPAYQQAYAELAQEFDYVNFVQEHDFSAQMESLVASHADLVCFGCDDVVFQKPVDTQNVETLLTEQRIIGVSLRLGHNVSIGMFGQPQGQPLVELAGPGGEFVTWDMDRAIGDWAYPWDVLGTIYRSTFVRAMWPSVRAARNPSQFEDLGSRAWRDVIEQRHYACWNSPSRIVVPTPNVVQSEFGNGFVGQCGLDADFLLQCWQRGMRMDTDRYASQLWPSWRIGDFYLRRIPS